MGFHASLCCSKTLSAKPWYFHISCKAVHVVYPICETSACPCRDITYNLLLNPFSLSVPVRCDVSALKPSSLTPNPKPNPNPNPNPNPTSPVLDYHGCYKQPTSTGAHAKSFPKREVLKENTVGIGVATVVRLHADVCCCGTRDGCELEVGADISE